MARLKATLRLRKHIHHRGALALFSYFLLSLALTLLNKFSLQEVCSPSPVIPMPVRITRTNTIRQIKSPYLLTALHALASWLGCAVLLNKGRSTFRKWDLPIMDHVKLVVFSVLYSLNIGISNVSL